MSQTILELINQLWWYLEAEILINVAESLQFLFRLVRFLSTFYELRPETSKYTTWTSAVRFVWTRCFLLNAGEAKCARFPLLRVQTTLYKSPFSGNCPVASRWAYFRRSLHFTYFLCTATCTNQLAYRAHQLHVQPVMEVKWLETVATYIKHSC